MQLDKVTRNILENLLTGFWQSAYLCGQLNIDTFTAGVEATREADLIEALIRQINVGPDEAIKKEAL
jgi:hypothetical protein